MRNLASIILLLASFALYADELKLTAAKYYDGTYCYIDESGKPIITGPYIEAHVFSNGLARVLIKDGDDKRYVFIDQQGNIKINPPRITAIEGSIYEYEITDDFSEGLARISLLRLKSNKLPKDDMESYEYGYGYITTEGKVISNPLFSRSVTLGRFHNGYATINKKNGVGFINKACDIIIQPIYMEAFDFNNDLAKVRYMNTAKKYGYIDITGKCIIKPEYNYASDFSEGMALVKDTNSNWSYIDTNGDIKIKLMSIFNINEESNNNKMALICPGPPNNFHNGKALILFNYYNDPYTYGSKLVLIGLDGTIIKSIDRKHCDYENEANTYCDFTDGKLWLSFTEEANRKLECRDLDLYPLFATKDLYLILGKDDNGWTNLSQFTNNLSKVYNPRKEIIYINNKGQIIYKE